MAEHVPFILLSLSITVLFPILSILCFLFGVHCSFKKYEEEQPEDKSGYVPYVAKKESGYKAYIPGKDELNEEIDG